MRYLYFAYGSNMMTARLARRCSSAIPVGPAFADGYRLTFGKRGADGSGKGHLAVETGGRQPGVLFEIHLAERATLDSFEGVGLGYKREDRFPVRRAADGRIVEAATYLATDPRDGLLPFDWYLALIVMGARDHGFGEATIARLLETPYQTDPWEKRPRRIEALRLLREAETSLDAVLAGRPRR